MPSQSPRKNRKKTTKPCSDQPVSSGDVTETHQEQLEQQLDRVQQHSALQAGQKLECRNQKLDQKLECRDRKLDHFDPSPEEDRSEKNPDRKSDHLDPVSKDHLEKNLEQLDQKWEDHFDPSSNHFDLSSNHFDPSSTEDRLKENSDERWDDDIRDDSPEQQVAAKRQRRRRRLHVDTKNAAGIHVDAENDPNNAVSERWACGGRSTDDSQCRNDCSININHSFNSG